MAEHTYRVTVRGRFADLTDDQRADLRRHLEGFDFLSSGGFSEEGALTFDDKLDFFSYRVILAAENDSALAKAEDAGLRRAATALDALGVDFKGLRATATDMDEMKINRPKRLG